MKTALYHIRTRCNYSQSMAARELGVSRPLISRMLSEARELGVVEILIHEPGTRASSLLDLPVGEKTVAIGEVGLGGEIRSVTHLETRLREAQRVGFDTAIVPRHNLKMIDPRQFPGLRLIGVAYLREAVNCIKLKD